MPEKDRVSRYAWMGGLESIMIDIDLTMYTQYKKAKGSPKCQWDDWLYAHGQPEKDRLMKRRSHRRTAAAFYQANLDSATEQETSTETPYAPPIDEPERSLPRSAPESLPAESKSEQARTTPDPASDKEKSTETSCTRVIDVPDSSENPLIQLQPCSEEQELPNPALGQKIAFEIWEKRMLALEKAKQDRRVLSASAPIKVFLSQVNQECSKKEPEDTQPLLEAEVSGTSSDKPLAELLAGKHIEIQENPATAEIPKSSALENECTEDGGTCPSKTVGYLSAGSEPQSYPERSAKSVVPEAIAEIPRSSALGKEDTCPSLESSSARSETQSDPGKSAKSVVPGLPSGRSLPDLPTQKSIPKTGNQTSAEIPRSSALEKECAADGNICPSRRVGSSSARSEMQSDPGKSAKSVVPGLPSGRSLPDLPTKKSIPKPRVLKRERVREGTFSIPDEAEHYRAQHAKPETPRSLPEVTLLKLPEERKVQLLREIPESNVLKIKGSLDDAALRRAKSPLKLTLPEVKSESGKSDVTLAFLKRRSQSTRCHTCTPRARPDDEPKRAPWDTSLDLTDFKCQMSVEKGRVAKLSEKNFVPRTFKARTCPKTGRHPRAKSLS